MTAIIVFLIILVLGVVSFTASFGKKNQTTTMTVENTGNSASSVTRSSNSREKIDTDLIFDSNCIVDELGWFDDADAAGKTLEDFFDATGVQPYIYFKDYDASLTTNSEKEEYAKQWYEDNIDNEGTFLFIYFAEEDTDNDVGYMYYVCGYDIESVMDEEACDIFWDYVDKYWYTDLSTDDMITEIFNSLADAIM
ncbi:MAG: hypothetical protein LUD16_02560 [Lachnospiraceae bacterium]|nr:hypothetical protein [Lachnospiraceae bacterium]